MKKQTSEEKIQEKDVVARLKEKLAAINDEKTKKSMKIVETTFQRLIDEAAIRVIAFEGTIGEVLRLLKDANKIRIKDLKASCQNEISLVTADIKKIQSSLKLAKKKADIFALQRVLDEKKQALGQILQVSIEYSKMHEDNNFLVGKYPEKILKMFDSFVFILYDFYSLLPRGKKSKSHLTVVLLEQFFQLDSVLKHSCKNLCENEIYKSILFKVGTVLLYYIEMINNLISSRPEFSASFLEENKEKFSQYRQLLDAVIKISEKEEEKYFVKGQRILFEFAIIKIITFTKCSEYQEYLNEAVERVEFLIETVDKKKFEGLKQQYDTMKEEIKLYRENQRKQKKSLMKGKIRFVASKEDFFNDAGQEFEKLYKIVLSLIHLDARFQKVLDSKKYEEFAELNTHFNNLIAESKGIKKEYVSPFYFRFNRITRLQNNIQGQIDLIEEQKEEKAISDAMFEELLKEERLKNKKETKESEDVKEAEQEPEEEEFELSVEKKEPLVAEITFEEKIANFVKNKQFEEAELLIKEKITAEANGFRKIKLKLHLLDIYKINFLKCTDFGKKYNQLLRLMSFYKEVLFNCSEISNLEKMTEVEGWLSCTETFFFSKFKKIEKQLEKLPNKELEYFLGCKKAFIEAIEKIKKYKIQFLKVEEDSDIKKVVPSFVFEIMHELAEMGNILLSGSVPTKHVMNMYNIESNMPILDYDFICSLSKQQILNFLSKSGYFEKYKYTFFSPPGSFGEKFITFTFYLPESREEYSLDFLTVPDSTFTKKGLIEYAKQKDIYAKTLFLSAYNKIFDPTGEGVEDCVNKRIRFINPKEDDPSRLLNSIKLHCYGFDASEVKKLWRAEILKLVPDYKLKATLNKIKKIKPFYDSFMELLEQNFKCTEEQLLEKAKIKIRGSASPKRLGC